MSFLDNIKMFGIIALVVGIISIIMGAYGGFDGGAIGLATGAVGGLMLLILGLLIYMGKFDSKPEVVSGYLMIYGLGFVIMGAMSYDTLGTCIAYIIVGIISMFIGYRMYSGNKNGPIWWYLLVIIFILLILINLINVINFDFGTLGGILATVANVLLAVVNIYMLAFLFDSSVKSKFAL